MSLQRRPLTGMQTNPPTAATPPTRVPSAPAAAAVAHQVDATQAQTFLDVVTLDLHNAGAADQTVRVIAVGGAPIDILVPTLTTVRVFDAQPFFGVPGNPGASQITVLNVTAQPLDAVVFFGHFTR